MREVEAQRDEARQRLQVAIEEYETSREEMRAANEELQSTNEELRSTMEELETSKEELQSLNEELSTLNQQLEGKVQELEASGNDLRNLLNSADFPAIFLSRDLRIKRFTPAVRRLLNLLPGDVGRPLSDFAHELLGPDMRREAEQVLERLAPVETELATAEGQRYVRRILPYCTEDDRVAGVVVTLMDVTSVRKAEDIEVRLAAIVRSSVDPIIVKNLDGTILDWNDAAERTYGYSAKEAIGRDVRLLIPDERKEEFDEIMARLRRGEATQGLETVRVTRSGERRNVLLNVSPLLDTRGTIIGGSAVAHDITERMRAEELFRAAVAASPNGLVMVDADGVVRLDTADIGVQHSGPLHLRVLLLPVDEGAGRHRVTSPLGQHVRKVLTGGIDRRAQAGHTRLLQQVDESGIGHRELAGEREHLGLQAKELGPRPLRIEPVVALENRDLATADAAGRVHHGEVRRRAAVRTFGCTRQRSGVGDDRRRSLQVPDAQQMLHVEEDAGSGHAHALPPLFLPSSRP